MRLGVGGRVAISLHRQMAVAPSLVEHGERDGAIAGGSEPLAELVLEVFIADRSEQLAAKAEEMTGPPPLHARRPERIESGVVARLTLIGLVVGPDHVEAGAVLGGHVGEHGRADELIVGIQDRDEVTLLQRSAQMHVGVARLAPRLGVLNQRVPALEVVLQELARDLCRAIARTVVDKQHVHGLVRLPGQAFQRCSHVAGAVAAIHEDQGANRRKGHAGFLASARDGRLVPCGACCARVLQSTGWRQARSVEHLGFHRSIRGMSGSRPGPS